jgi:hypothetical protein
MKIYQARQVDSDSFITFTRLDSEAFECLLIPFKEAWNSESIYDGTGVPAERHFKRRLLNAEAGLGLALHFMASKTEENNLGLHFGLTGSSSTKYIWFSMRCLLKALRSVPEGRIEWPDPQKRLDCAWLVEQKYMQLTGDHASFAFIDGKRFLLRTPTSIEQNVLNYNGWKHLHSVVSLIIFDPLGEVIFHFSNAPGSFHDSKILRLSGIIQIIGNIWDNEKLNVLADTGFPSVDGLLRRSKENEIRTLSVEMENVITKARTNSEWGNNVLTSSMRRLMTALPLSARKRRVIFEIAFSFHNFRTRKLGHNQIRKHFDLFLSESNEQDFFHAVS